METFSALLASCAGNSPVTGEFPAQRPVTRTFDVFFDLRLNKRLSKQSWGWWFETLSRPLWRHRNENCTSCSARVRIFQRNVNELSGQHGIFWFDYTSCSIRAKTSCTYMMIKKYKTQTLAKIPPEIDELLRTEQKFWNGSVISPSICNKCNYLSMFG